MLAQQLAQWPSSKLFVFVGLNRGPAPSCLEAGWPSVCVGFLPPSEHLQLRSTPISKLSVCVAFLSFFLPPVYSVCMVWRTNLSELCGKG